MSKSIDHILLTRFNLPSDGVEGRVRAREGWLTQRVQLFERYCLPTVTRQTNPDFSWIIYFDPQSPDSLKSWIDQHAARGNFHPIFRESVTNVELLSDIADTVTTRSETLLTTNVDNDDGVADDFVDRLQRATTTTSRSAIYLTNGLVKSKDGVYLRADPNNAFCSVQESWSEAVTCWSDWHNRLSVTMPVHLIGGAPGWLQVVHGSNVSNRTRGRLVSPLPFRHSFPIVLDDVPVPTTRALMSDRMIRSPLRVARDRARSAVSRSAMAIGGKDGLDRLKVALQSARTRGRA